MINPSSPSCQDLYKFWHPTGPSSGDIFQDAHENNWDSHEHCPLATPNEPVSW